MQEIILELINISKQYGRRQLFSNINRLIRSGECIAVTGPNGSGKSSLLKVIAGLIRPSSGTVKVKSKGLEIPPDKRMSCFGLISPELIMYNTMTGYENLDFLVRARGVELSGEQLIACLETVGLSGRRHELISTYSTGMRQRLKFALLAALMPPVWLLDEPSSNLDQEGTELVKRLVNEALAQQAIVMIATNDQEEASYARQKITLV